MLGAAAGGGEAHVCGSRTVFSRTFRRTSGVCIAAKVRSRILTFVSSECALPAFQGVCQDAWPAQEQASAAKQPASCESFAGDLGLRRGSRR